MKGDLRIEISLRTLLAVVAVAAAAWLAVKLWVVLLVVVIALMIVFALEPPVERLEARGWRRPWALAAVFGGLTLAFVGFCAVTLVPLVSQVSGIVRDAPMHQRRMLAWLQAHPPFDRMASLMLEWMHGDDPAGSWRSATTYVVGVAPRALEVLAYGLSAVFLALYFMADRVRMRGVVYALVPRGWHVRLARVTIQLETIVGGYIRGQVVTSALMGFFLFTLLTIFRVPNAVALAALGAFGDVIPYVGVLLTIAPSALAALSRGAGTAIVVAICCAAYQEFENRVIIPRVYGKVLRLPSAAVILALLAGGVLGGVLGAILALPVAAAVRMLVEELRLAMPGDDSPEETAVRLGDEHVEHEFRSKAAGTSATEAAGIAVALAEKREKQHRTSVPPITSGLERKTVP